jgi:hypothetical protein
MVFSRITVCAAWARAAIWYDGPDFQTAASALANGFIGAAITSFVRAASPILEVDRGIRILFPRGP